MTRQLFKQTSVKDLLNHMPLDGGCILVFNGLHRNWRSKASEYRFEVHKINIDAEIARTDDYSLCDLYITPNKEWE
jgi:hypothetical protein